ncbi:Subtilisin-like serine protease [uncultured archaeon]|nr:Subtilisin-like serine protease [uncultured archaeon]
MILKKVSSLLFEKKIVFLIFIFVFLLFLSGIFSVIAEAKSDKIKGDIKSHMLKGENVPVIIILKDRAALKAVSKGDAAAMKDAASGSQRKLSAVLDEEKNRGKANKIKQLWIVNAIAVNASPDLIESLSMRDDVASIEPDSEVKIVDGFSAQVSQGQINSATSEIKRINTTKIWELGIDGSGVNVSVIDSGIDYNHPDLKGRVIKGYDFVNNDNDPMDDNGHGTHVAGIVGGNGSEGTTTGVAPNVSLFGVKVLDSAGSGSESDVISGIEWSVSNGANIISMSLGTFQTWTTANCDADNPAMTTAINNAVNAGVVVVAAAGNNVGGVSSPGCIQNAIAAGAVDNTDNIAYFSGRGAAMADHGVVAPGVDIYSLNYLGGYTFMSGTSMATPHVSGTIALLLNASQRQGTTLSPPQVKAVLNNTSIDLGGAGKDNIYGAGRINVSAAVLSIDTTGLSVTANPTGYPSGNTAAKNGTAITLNATITDAISGVKNASVNVSSINSSFTDASLAYDSGFWKNNSIIVNASDGTYYLNITAYDNMNNVNNSSRLSVTVDNTPPLIINTSATPTQIEAGSGSSILKANITDNTSGVAQVTVNLSAIGGSSASPMQNISGVWQLSVNTTAIGNFSLSVNATDGAGNFENMDVLLNVTDTTPPLISHAAAVPDSIKASGTDYAILEVGTGDFANVSSIRNVTVNLSSIGGSAAQEMQNSGGLWLFNVSTSTTGIDGTLISLPVNVTDSGNNSNTTASILLGIKKTFTAVIGTPISLNLTIGTVNFNFSITIPESAVLSGEPLFAPIDIPAYGDMGYAGVALNISNLSFDMPLRIEVEYNSSLITENESKLRLWTYNTTASRWEITDNSSVDTINKTVTGYTSHLSIFAPLADVTPPVISGVAVSSITTNSATVTWTTDEASQGSVRYGTGSGVYTSTEEETSNVTSHSVQLTGLSAGTRYYYIVSSKDQSDNTANSTEISFTTSSSGGGGSSASGGGGGGGGGGGASAENATNIEIKEKYDLYIYKDKVTAYAFTNRSNPVLFVNITGNISAGEINTAVEILRNTSSLVKTPALGSVYKNINIWVGTSGFAVPRNIKNAEITFRVEKEWVKQFEPGTITLYHYDSGWVALPTRKIKEDDVFEYYAAQTRKFSPFAITMLRATAQEPASSVAAAQVTAAVTADIPAKVNPGPIPVVQKTETGIMLIATAILVLITAILAAVYIFEKMKIAFSPK